MKKKAKDFYGISKIATGILAMIFLFHVCATEAAELMEKQAGEPVKPIFLRTSQECIKQKSKLLFPVGVNIYGDKEIVPDHKGQSWPKYQQWLESTFKDISSHHCNSIYLADISWYPDAFKAAVTVAQKYNLSIFAQLSGPMYLAPDQGMDYYHKQTLASAKMMIPQYLDLTGIVAWIPKEEPTIEDLPLLQEYRQQIRIIDHQHGLYTVHNYIQPLIQDTHQLPDWFGFDRYRFGSMFGDYGAAISTPKDMALRLRDELSQFQAATAKLDRPLIFVMQGYGNDWYGPTEEMLKLSYGVLPPADSGWKQVKPGYWFGWIRYPPPKYGMRLQCWLGILEGVKGLYVHMYNSYGQAVGHRVLALVPDTGHPSDQWTEFGETIAEIEPILPLARRWTKLDAAPAATTNPEVFITGFKDPCTAKQYIVVVNARISEWDNTSPRFLGYESKVRFGPNGIEGLTTAGKIDAVLTVRPGMILKDYISQVQYTAGPDGIIKLEIPPGDGFVFEIVN